MVITCNRKFINYSFCLINIYIFFAFCGFPIFTLTVCLFKIKSCIDFNGRVSLFSYPFAIKAIAICAAVFRTV